MVRKELGLVWFSEQTCRHGSRMDRKNTHEQEETKGAARGGAEGAQAPPLAIRILMFIS